MKSVHDALITIRRSPYQSLLAVLMISITFFVGYTISMLLLGAESILKFFETRPQVIAFFELEASESSIKSLTDSIKQKDYVNEVKLVSKDEALEIYKQDNRENPLLLELVTADILPASLEVSAKDAVSLAKIKTDLEAGQEIDEVVYPEDIVDSLTRWTNSIRIFGLASTVVLAFTSFLTIVVVIGMKTANKRNAVKIMKILGATNWYIISPFLTEGMLYGVLGSLIGFLGMYSLMLYATPWLSEFFGSIIAFPIPNELYFWQLGIGSGAGMLLGFFACLVATQRILRR